MKSSLGRNTGVFQTSPLGSLDFNKDAIIDPRPRLKNILTPVLVIRGECDYIPAAVTTRYDETLPNARLVEIPNSGHALISAQPEIVLAEIRAFLTS